MMNHKEFTSEILVKSIPSFTNAYAEVNGVKLHYVIGGQGEPLILIPGYPETWWAYHKIMPLLAAKYRVIVVEIRGMGDSDKPVDGYEKKNLAKDIFEFTKLLEFKKVHICGHDIGAHVAFSFAANYPDSTKKLIILDTPHPDAGMYHLPMLPILGANYLYPWWLAFNQVKELPEQLLEGRMHILIDWFFKNSLHNQDSITDIDKKIYANAYNSKEAIRASNAWYQAFPYDIEDMKNYAKLNMPVLGIGASGYSMLEMSLPILANDLQLKKIEDSGHYLLSEKPDETAKLILDFLS